MGAARPALHGPPDLRQDMPLEMQAGHTVAAPQARTIRGAPGLGCDPGLPLPPQDLVGPIEGRQPAGPGRRGEPAGQGQPPSLEARGVPSKAHHASSPAQVAHRSGARKNPEGRTVTPRCVSCVKVETALRR